MSLFFGWLPKPPDVGISEGSGDPGTRQGILITGIVGWAVVVAIGLRVLLVYANTPGRAASPPPQWPSASPVALAPNADSLVLFLHPQCPCSRATLGELDKILACCRERIQLTVFFYHPVTALAGWTETELWRMAAAMPGVRLLSDPDAAAARMFGAHVSGQALLYDSRGRLLFNGGITAFRGHAGDNDGRDAIQAIAADLTPKRRTTPVFGCALYEQN
jgi:hypothetical protein